MKKDEIIHDFHMNIIDIANSSSDLGEKIPEVKLVRKILRFLPKRFDMKVTAIEEAQDIDSMKVDELMGSLQTYELAIGEKTEKKKSIALYHIKKRMILIKIYLRLLRYLRNNAATDEEDG